LSYHFKLFFIFLADTERKCILKRITKSIITFSFLGVCFDSGT